MNALVILLAAFAAGLVAAVASLISGGTIWAAVLSYLGYGMAATMVLTGLALLRAWSGERRPAARLALQPRFNGSGK